MDRVTPALPPSLSAAAAQALTDRGVRLALGSPVQSVDPVGIILGSGRRIEADNVIWAAGVKPHPLLARSGIETEKGRMGVDGHFRTGVANVFAVGDAAGANRRRRVLAPDRAICPPPGSVPRSPPPDDRRRGEVEPFRYHTKGELVSLGHHNAVGQVLGVPVSGLLGWFLWRTYYLLQLPTMLRRARVRDRLEPRRFLSPDIAWLPSSDLGPL